MATDESSPALEAILLDYLLPETTPLRDIAERVMQKGWNKNDSRTIIRSIISLARHQPDAKSSAFIYYMMDQLPHVFPYHHMLDIKNFVSFMQRLEELKGRYSEGVGWAYDIFHSWRKETEKPGSCYRSTDLLNDLLESQQGMLKAVTASDEIRREVCSDLTEINTLSIAVALPVRHNQFGQIAAESVELYYACAIEKENKPLYDAGIAFRKKALLGSNQEILLGLAELPAPLPEKLVELIKDAIEEIDADCKDIIDDPTTEGLADLIETVIQAYQEHEAEEVNHFIRQFKILPGKRSSDSVNALCKQLLTYTSGDVEAIAYDIEQAWNLIDRLERKSALYFLRKYQIIKKKLGNDEANNFAENVSLFDCFGLTKINEFIDLYSRFLLKTLPAEKAGILAPTLRTLIEFSRNKEEHEIILKKILRRGPTSCSPYLMEKLKEATGMDIEQYLDLRPLQKTLYTTYPSFLSFQALADAGFCRENYLQLAEDLAGLGIIDTKQLVFAGGCGIAKKEAVLIKKLRELCSSDELLSEIELILNDNSKPARDLALLTCVSEGICEFSHPPPVVDWDIERLHPAQFAKYRELLADRQLIFTLFGGIAFNITNTRATYARIRDIFMRRAYGDLYDRTATARAAITVWKHLRGQVDKKTYLERREEGAMPDLIITEWNRSKDMGYYHHPSSIEFLNRGVDAGYQISAKDLAHDGPIFIPDEQGHKVSSFYILKKGHRLNEDGMTPAVLVIDSGKPDEKRFEQTMNEVGLSSQFFRYNGSIVAVSQIQSPERELERRVGQLIKLSDEFHLGRL